MFRIGYLFDTPGWALDNIGRLLQRQLRPLDIDVRCIPEREWHLSPARFDSIYLSYSGLVVEGFPYRRWCGTLLTTIHDPCEISLFEDRFNWFDFPFLPLPLSIFDRISVISGELERIVPDAYGVPVYRTPTWPMMPPIQDQESAGRHDQPVRAMSTTILPEFFTSRQILKRFRHPGHYCRNQDGHWSLRLARALTVHRRRKNIKWLREIRGHFGAGSGVSCNFRFGPTPPLPRPQYEEEMRRSDVYVCTSTMEGGPLPVMEAVASGLAVLTTPVGQVEDWVFSGENGRICRTVDDFINVLGNYASNPELLAAHQARSRRIMANAIFPVEKWIAFLTGST